MMPNRSPRPHRASRGRTVRRSHHAFRAVMAASLAGLVLIGAAGCGMSPDNPTNAGAPATGLPTDASTSGAMRIYFTTANGVWPVWRDAGEGADPQAAIDALAEGPDETERARGISSALPTDTVGLTATVSDGRVDITLPWNISTIDPNSVTQLACTAAAAPGIPGGHDPTEVLVVFHEPIDPTVSFPVTCDEAAEARPGDTP